MAEIKLCKHGGGQEQEALPAFSSWIRCRIILRDTETRTESKRGCAACLAQEGL